MKKFSTFLFAAILVFGVAYNAAAYSGTYMFTLEGNDSNYGDALLQQKINEWFDANKIDYDVNLSFYSKLDAPATINSSMTLVYADDNKSGLWSTQQAVEFYSVKASTEFAFYWIEGGATSGTWSTEHLKNGGGSIPEISHLSTWSPVTATPGTGSDPNATPEPATMVLLGIGLMGVATVGRKAKN